MALVEKARLIGSLLTESFKQKLYKMSILVHRDNSQAFILFLAAQSNVIPLTLVLTVSRHLICLLNNEYRGTAA